MSRVMSIDLLGCPSSTSIEMKLTTLISRIVGVTAAIPLLVQGGDLTLTGLARHRGKAYAYLASGKSGESFSLKLGQELANLKLESVDFTKGEAVVVSGEERLVLALERRSKESISGSTPVPVPPPGLRPHLPPGGFPRRPGTPPMGMNPNSNFDPNSLTAPPPRTLAEAQALHPEATYTEGAAEMTVTTPGTMVTPPPMSPPGGPNGAPGVPGSFSKIPIAVGITSPDDPSPEPPEPTDH